MLVLFCKSKIKIARQDKHKKMDQKLVKQIGLLKFENFLQKYLKHCDQNQTKLSRRLVESMKYSLSNGGKRFRPALGLALADGLNLPKTPILPWLLAIEMIHTYSLIHDDLPALDNDDYRRGKPTNHKIFGEDLAILSGDVLAIEAFAVIAHYYRRQAKLTVELVTDLATAIGVHGMVKGQVIDLSSKHKKLSKDAILQMHQLKTGALIQVTLVGTAKVFDVKKTQLSIIAQMGQLIGLAFQIKDDLLDSQNHIEPGSLCATIGINQVKKLLQQIETKLNRYLMQMNLSESLFKRLIEFNFHRQT